MATNIVHEAGDALYLTCTAPTTPNAGDPVLIGKLPGVALTDEQSDGKTSVKLNGTANLAVKGETTTDAAIAAGDIVYYDGGTINADSSNGTRFGYALEAVSSGATSTILVKIGY